MRTFSLSKLFSVASRRDLGFDDDDVAVVEGKEEKVSIRPPLEAVGVPDEPIDLLS